MGPCAPWVTEDDLPTERPELPAGGPSWDEITRFASDVLFDLSGQRWTGLCGEVTAVLDSCTCGCSSSATPWTPVLIDGEIYNCRCGTPAVIRLPDTSVIEVLEVTERGTVRAPGSYKLDRPGYLRDLSGRGWGTCPGGIAVRYTAGILPPAGGITSARTLALELGKAAAGDGTCKLPARVSSVVRQGVTIGVLDRWQDLDKGRVGLYTVDLWLSSVTRPVQGAAVWSPDVPTAHR